jgi:nitrate reductase gamma subunit
MILLLTRRASSDRLVAVTTKVDWLLLVALLLQVITGVYIAVTLRWGGFWYLHTVTPWLWSLVGFSPKVEYLVNMPFVVKLHAFNAFFLVAIFPFSRLVHVVSIPLSYISRPYQVVVWYRERNQA